MIPFLGEQEKKMISFSISQFEQLSGIKTHTLRVWESRFALFQPNRVEGRNRTYNFSDFRRLLNISLLNQSGFKISHLASLTPLQIEQKIEEITDTDFSYKRTQNKLLVSIYCSDYGTFHSILDDSVQSVGIDLTIREVIIPFIERINLMSYTDQGTKTHIMVGAIRNKIINGIELADSKNHPDLDIMLLLPEGDHYDLILHYCTYLLKSAGTKILYLGTNIPFRNLGELSDLKPSSIVVTYLPEKSRFNALELSRIYKRHFPQSFIVITHPILKKQRILNEERVKFIHYSDLLKTISQITGIDL
jgi:DNA-binding transcriptional MerR regulator